MGELCKDNLKGVYTHVDIKKWEQGWILHKNILDVINKMLKSYIEKGQVYVKNNMGKGADIIVKYGNKVEEVESKSLGPSWWMSTGWCRSEILSRFSEKADHRWCISTYDRIFTDEDHRLFEDEKVCLVLVGHKPVSKHDRKIRAVLYKKLYPLYKRIQSYYNNFNLPIRSNVVYSNNIQYKHTNLHNFTTVFNDILYSNDIFDRNLDPPDQPRPRYTSWEEGGA
jgi:hypothetical protein